MDKNKDCRHDHHGGGFTNGFIFGFVLGGIVVFLLGTKKGKQIMQTLAENGFEGISELTELMEEEEDDGEYEEEYIDESPEEVPASDQSVSPAPVVHEKRIVVVHRPASRPVKRFFRGVKR